MATLSTLLEILLDLPRDHVIDDILLRFFQPFLRFYIVFLDEIFKASSAIFFQPFLRFYVAVRRKRRSLYR